MEVKTSTDSNWRGLFKIAGVAGIVAGLLCIVDIMVFVVFPQPTTVEGWFALFQKNWLVGFLDSRPSGDSCIRRFIPCDPFSFHHTKENESILDGNSHYHDIHRHGSLLCIEYGVLPPLHQQPIRCGNDRCSEEYLPSGGADSDYCLFANCFQREFHLRFLCAAAYVNYHASQQFLQQKDRVHWDPSKPRITGRIHALVDYCLAPYVHESSSSGDMARPCRPNLSSNWGRLHSGRGNQELIKMANLQDQSAEPQRTPTLKSSPIQYFGALIYPVF